MGFFKIAVEELCCKAGFVIDVVGYFLQLDDAPSYLVLE